MIKPAPEQPRGVGGMALLFCAVALIVGLGFDFALRDGARFSVIGEPGGRAVLGLGVAAAAVLIAHALRLILGRPPRGDGEEH